MIGTFTSDESGNITTAFLGEGKEYTLTETSTPQGYHGVEYSLIIKAESGTVTVNGSDENPEDGYYTLTQAATENGSTTPAIMIIKNRPYTLQAIKMDGDTQDLLAGVHFELHKQVTVDGVTSFDLNPMTGYADLVTDMDGVIPKLDNTLPAGTYQLREKTAPSGYQTLPGYIEFTVSETGAVSLLLSTSSVDWVTLTSSADDRTLAYVLTILNFQRKKVSFKKVDISNIDNSALAGAVFDLYSVTVVNETEIRQTPALYTGLTSGDDGLLRDGDGNSVFDLPVGKYHLIETAAPAGYIMRTEPIIVQVKANTANPGAVVYDEGTNLSESGVGKSYNSTTKVYTLKLSNTSGMALPSTGGPGTRLFTILGSILVMLAAVLLWRRRFI